MKSSVSLRIDKYLDGGVIENGAIVQVRAINDRGGSELVQRLAVNVSSRDSDARRIELEPGTYEVSAVLPSGEVVSQSLDLKDVAQDVVLRGGRSPHEWLSWQQWSGNVGEAAPKRQLEAAFSTASSGIGDALDRITARLWSVPNGHGDDPLWPRLSEAFATLEPGKSVAPSLFADWSSTAAALPLERSEPYLAVRLPDHPAGNGRSYLHVDDGRTGVLCPMPWPWQQVNESGNAVVEVVIAIDEELIGAGLEAGSKDAQPVWSARPNVRDQRLGGLLAYFTAGEVGIARELMLEPARFMLHQKMNNPYAAAAGAYILSGLWIQNSAQGEGSPNWLGWVDNLTHYFPWLPDGAIVKGWLALRMRDQDPRIDEAREALLDAERRGIPYYSMGVRRLVDGLLLVSAEMQRRGIEDPQVADALRRARQLAWQVDPRQPFTCVRLHSQ